eukprot:7988791-Pyramimonas_sp.AAC.1
MQQATRHGRLRKATKFSHSPAPYPRPLLTCSSRVSAMVQQTHSTISSSMFTPIFGHIGTSKQQGGRLPYWGSREGGTACNFLRSSARAAGILGRCRRTSPPAHRRPPRGGAEYRAWSDDTSLKHNRHQGRCAKSDDRQPPADRKK